MAPSDDLRAKEAAKFLHDIDDYGFDDSVDHCFDFSIENVVLTNWGHAKKNNTRTFIVSIPSQMDQNHSDMIAEC